MQRPSPTTQTPLADAGLNFAPDVPNDGYRWWYLDAFSSDGKHALTIILFVGSVFSPYYFRARRSGSALAENYCSANVIFYGPDRKRWAMTERGSGDLKRSKQHFQVANTVARVEGSQLLIDIDEWCVPLPSKLTGRVTCQLPTLTTECFALDDHGRHRWWPMAPCVNVEVQMARPDLRWSGQGYLDTNAGSEPLERGFKQWQWQRSELQQGRGSITYVALTRDNNEHRLQLAFDADGELSRHDLANISPVELAPGTVWRMPRVAYSDGGDIGVIKTYEDTPFYTRSLLLSQSGSEHRKVMHESLDLDRFVRPWVQRLLPFRMPRRAT